MGHIVMPDCVFVELQKPRRYLSWRMFEVGYVFLKLRERLCWMDRFWSYQHTDQLVCEDTIHTHRIFQRLCRVKKKDCTQGTSWMNTRSSKKVKPRKGIKLKELKSYFFEVYEIYQRLTNFLCKGPIINISGFLSHMVSVPTIQPHHRLKAVIGNS